MNFGFTEEQELLRKTARDFLAERSPLGLARQVMEGPEDLHRDLWRAIARLGWTGLTVPERFGGAGLSAVELCIVLEEAGRVLCPVPLASSAIASFAIDRAGSDAQRGRWLPQLASGERIAAVALAAAGDGGHASARGDGFALSGTWSLVRDAGAADLLVLAAQPEGASIPSLFVVDAGAEAVRRVRRPGMDRLRPVFDVVLDGLVVDAEARLAPSADPRHGLAAVGDAALVMIAAGMLGGAEACLESAVAYAKDRVQFGKPIGVHQAIKHKCADLLFAVEATRSIVYYAAWALREGVEDAQTLAAMAKATASDAFVQAAQENLQIHGGVGFTWEYDCHLFLKRARNDETWLGDAAHHRERIATLLRF